jgi:hypothetical protein
MVKVKLPELTRPLETIAILYAPGIKPSRVSFLEKKMRDFLDRLDLSTSEILLNPPQLHKPSDPGRNEGFITLLIGWGLPAQPAWDRWLNEWKIPKWVRQVIAVDLFERRNLKGKLLDVPYVNAGKYWSQKTRQMNLGLFLKGCYLKPVAPFGLKRTLSKRKKERAPTTRSHYNLVLAESEKVEIVRLIFDLYVNSDYTLTSIANLLNAQGINPPQQSSTAWRIRMVRSILETWAYIGSNEYCGCYKHNVFPAVVDRGIFFEAQAKIARSHGEREQQEKEA